MDTRLLRSRPRTVPGLPDQHPLHKALYPLLGRCSPEKVARIFERHVLPVLAAQHDPSCTKEEYEVMHDLDLVMRHPCPNLDVLVGLMAWLPRLSAAEVAEMCARHDHQRLAMAHRVRAARRWCDFTVMLESADRLLDMPPEVVDIALVLLKDLPENPLTEGDRLGSPERATNDALDVLHCLDMASNLHPLGV